MPTTINLSFDEWFEKFKPIINPDNTDSGLSINDDFYMFETYGDDLDKVVSTANTAPLTVWTWIEGDEGEFIVNDYHLVNRLGYFITEVPAEPDTFYEIDYND